MGKRIGRKRLYSLNKLGQKSANAAGPGIADAIVASTVRREGHKIITEIVVDLGTSKATIKAKNDDGDAIGVENGGAAYLTQLTPAVNGHIVFAEMACLEVPNTLADIDLLTADEGTFAYDGDVAGGGNSVALVTAGGNWTLGGVDHHATTLGTNQDLATDDQYLYLASGTTTAATFTQGKYVITLEGYAVPDDK